MKGTRAIRLWIDDPHRNNYSQRIRVEWVRVQCDPAGARRLHLNRHPVLPAFERNFEQVESILTKSFSLPEAGGMCGEHKANDSPSRI